MTFGQVSRTTLIAIRSTDSISHFSPNIRQIFALIVSVVTIFTLLDEAREMEKEIWVAFFRSDLMPYEEKEQPKHYVPYPGLGLS